MSLVLADTSVWARMAQPSVGERLADAIRLNAVVTVQPLVLELLTSARSERDMQRLASLYDSLHRVPLTERIAARARRVQVLLARNGRHRGPSVTDLLCAAAAEHVGATVWHCDKHFEQIAQVTGQVVRRIGR